MTVFGAYAFVAIRALRYGAALIAALVAILFGTTTCAFAAVGDETRVGAFTGCLRGSR